MENIKAIINDYNIQPSALNGQNFLVDEIVLQTIIDTADIKSGENILEIGPGLGVLTNELLAAGAKVLAVEKDRQIFSYLKKRFKGAANLTLMNDDILRLDKYPSPYRIVANIPYSITGQIMSMFISGTMQKPADAVLLIQKEVAERICAGPGKLSLLGISVQLYGQPEIVSLVKSNAFWPEPKVDSAILRISAISQKPRYPLPDLARFWRLVRRGFSAPRKQLHNNLGVDKSCLAKFGINEKARAQELTIEQWIKLDGEQSFLI